MYNPARVPEEIIETLTLYKERHIPTGGFLQAVLSNNLVEACARADRYNYEVIPHIVGWCWNNLPRGSWGGPAQYRDWTNPDKWRERPASTTESGTTPQRGPGSDPELRPQPAERP
jgi:hypothetical protein